MLLLAAALPAACSSPTPSGTPRLLTTIASIRALPDGVARQGWPVRLRGVVTYADAGWGRLIIEDQNGALGIDISGTNQAYARGDRIEVAGWTAVSDITAVPLVNRPTIQRLGTTPPPTPPVVPLSALTSEVCDGRSLQTSGVVKQLGIWNGYLRIHVVTGQRSVELRVYEFPLVDMSPLVGASIQSPGVCIQAPAGEVKLADLRVMVSDFEDLGLPDTLRATLTKAAAALPVVTHLDEIRRMPRAEAGRYYPVRVGGVATYVDPAWNMLFLQDGATGIFVALQGAQSTVQAGDRLEVTRLDRTRQFRARDIAPNLPRARTDRAAP